MSHQSQLIKNTIIIAIGKLGTQVISYFLLPLYTKLLTPGDYGTYDFICTLAIFICPLITLLMEESMFRFLIDAKSEKEKKLIISQTIIYSAIGTIVFIPLALIVMGFGTEYSPGMQGLVIFFVISNLLLGLSNSLARGEGNIKLYSVSNFILGILTILLNIVLVVIFKSGNALLIANTIANIFTALFVFGKMKIWKYVGQYNKIIMNKMIKYSVPLVPNSISWAIINMSDRVLLTKISGEAVNGIYAMACKFPNIINVVYGYFYTAWKESSAKILKDEGSKKVYNSIYHDMKRLLFSVTIFLIAVMPFVFNLFINKQYGEAYIYIPLIIIATYYANLSSFIGGIFTAFKKTKIIGTTTVFAAIINLVVDLILIWKMQIYAACISTLLANLIIYYYRKYKLKDLVKLKELNMFGPGIILGIVCFTYYIRYFKNISIVTSYVINGIILLLVILYSVAVNKKIFIKILGKFIPKFKERT